MDFVVNVVRVTHEGRPDVPNSHVLVLDRNPDVVWQTLTAAHRKLLVLATKEVDSITQSKL